MKLARKMISDLYIIRTRKGETKCQGHMNRDQVTEKGELLKFLHPEYISSVFLIIFSLPKKRVKSDSLVIIHIRTQSPPI